MLKQLKKELREVADPVYAQGLQRFFKTGKGDYGEGDVFLGIKVPEQRKIAKNFLNLDFRDLQELLGSEIHDERMIALLILVQNFKGAKKEQIKRRQIFEFYLKNVKKGNVNNWDLVDISAPTIVGEFLLKSKNKILRDLAKAESLWEKRIAIVSTYAFIRIGEFEDTLKIAEILLNDSHDLIHKAVGWMLREVGKKNMNVLEVFLQSRYKTMPRTMLRYSIERFPEEKRKRYLKGEI